jgi:hypothetical protein
MEVVKDVCRLVSSGGLVVVVVGCCGRSKGDRIIVDTTSCVVLGQATYELLPLVAGLDGASACCCCLPLVLLLLFVGGKALLGAEAATVFRC